MRTFAGIVGLVATVAIALAVIAWRAAPPPTPVGSGASELIADIAPALELAPVSGAAAPATAPAGSPGSGG